MSMQLSLTDADDRGPVRRGRPSLGVRGVRRTSLPQLLVAEAVVGARAHGLRARARDGGRRARHAPLLQGDLRDARAPRRAIRPRADPAGGAHGRRAAQARGAQSLGDATPTAAVTSARSSRSSTRCARTMPGSPASGATNRPHGRARGRSSAPRATASGRSSRSLTGARKTSGSTSWRTTFRTTPSTTPGYRSIGCIPCTRPTSPDEEERAGRWAGSDKLECGIHLEERNA